MNSNSFPRLASHHYEIHPIYDVIVIGSGYGGAIAACRAARSGQGVCVLEKGKEWLPGEFPETLVDLKKNIHVTKDGKEILGNESDLFDVHVDNGVKILSGAGLGGGSLLSANVSLHPNEELFQEPEWPSDLRKDVKNLLEVDARNVEEMLTPSIWPNEPPYVEPMKCKLMKRSASDLAGIDLEDLGKYIKELPIWVNFKHGRNPIGIEQTACNGCGNCLSGCNTGAKNTLNVNYLADAKAHGAHIFTKIEVSEVTKDSYSGLWAVRYKRNAPGDFESQIVKSRLVFFAAGVIGTSRILFQSRKKGLLVSDKLGHNFLTNGFLHGFCGSMKDEVNAVGLSKDDDVRGHYQESNPGPASTMGIDLPKDIADVDNKSLIYDLTFPGATRFILSTILRVESIEDGFEKIFDRSFSETMEKNFNHSLSNVLPLCSTSKSKKPGMLKCDDEGKKISVEMPENHLVEAKNELVNFSKSLGGEFYEEPTGYGMGGHLSIHPLGGCIMGETGCDGVVNHKGQLFIGNSTETHAGIYIIDGSAIPCDIGIQPAATISMIAERCMRLCSVDHSWQLDYQLSHDIADKLVSDEGNQRLPGLMMTEKMVGELVFEKTKDRSYCDFLLTVESTDLKRMMNLDPEHSARITGTVTCPGLSKSPITTSEGVFKLLRDSKDQVNGKEMIYKMVLDTEEGKQFYFYGIKYIHLDEFGEVGLSDTTLLFITIYQGKDDTGEVVGKGELYMRFTDFAKQLTTITITNVKSVIDRWLLKAEFVKFFLKGLWDTYFRLAGGSLLDPSVPPRVKRELKFGDAVPEVHKVITEDHMELRLTRFQGGKKGPILLVHGLGVASNLFLIDTVEQNFVEYLVEQKYDVWLLDWRTSILLPWACYTQYTIDDCAKYDFPAAVDKVLSITKEKDLQLVIHCFGAITAIASVLLGKLEGKIRCILTSQVSATPVGSCVNKFKSQGCFASLFTKSGVSSLTAYVDKNSHWGEKTLNHMTRHFAYLTTKADQHCSSEVCHRITFLYGLLYEHRNLNVATHDILHELFGVATTKIFTHTALITRKERLVNFDGKDVYLPGYTKKNRLKDPAFRRKMDLLNFPIMFFNGEKNQCWNPENLILTYDMVRHANPNQDYVCYEVEGYGHLDTFMGSRAHIDVYPKLVAWLDKYADDHEVKSASVRSSVMKALIPDEDRIRRTKSTDETPKLLKFNELKEDYEIKALIDVSDGEGHDTLEPMSNENDEKKITFPNGQTLQIETMKDEKAGRNEGHEVERRMIWGRKNETKSSFHQSSRYVHPRSTEAEKVVIKAFDLDDREEKREIVVISDLHFGSDLANNIGPRLKGFLDSLIEDSASRLHSIVLLGDIFDMNTAPVAVTPISTETMLEQWQNDQTIGTFTKVMKDLAQERNVIIHFVRGDSDHDITEKMVKELFGEKVHFVPGYLIYKLDIGGQLYTIRFEHGHTADLFSDYNLQSLDIPGVKRPFSYFVQRLICSTEERFFVDSQNVISDYVNQTLEKLRPFGSTFVEILSKSMFSSCFCKKLMEKAIGHKLSGDECVIMEEDKWVRFSTIFNSTFLKQLIAKYGSSEVYKMLQSSVTDLSHHVRQCQEDVVVMGHIHKPVLEKIHTKGGKTIYANCGSSIDLVGYSSHVKISLPKTYENGKIQIITN